MYTIIHIFTHMERARRGGAIRVAGARTGLSAAVTRVRLRAVGGCALSGIGEGAFKSGGQGWG
jgi:hypothetical protein